MNARVLYFNAFNFELDRIEFVCNSIFFRWHNKAVLSQQDNVNESILDPFENGTSFQCLFYKIYNILEILSKLKCARNMFSSNQFTYMMFGNQHANWFT